MKNLFIILILTVLVYSCKKETEETIPQNVGLKDYVVIDTLGDYDYYGEINFKTNTDYSNLFSNCEIDLNNDGQNDINFRYNHYYSASGEDGYISNIDILDTCLSIVYSEITDTACSYYKTYYYQSGSNEYGVGAAYYYIMYDESHENDSLFTIKLHTANYPKLFDHDYTLSNNELYTNSDVSLKQYNSSSSPLGYSTRSFYDYRYGLLLNELNKFIGVKYVKNNEEYLGWIQFDNSGWGFYIKRYALKRVK